MTIKNVMIAGAGVLGSQISWQVAFRGFEVTLYDAFENGLETGKKFHQQYAELFLSERDASQKEIDDTFNRLTYTTNLTEAVKNADLVNESVPEVLSIKQDFYTALSKVAPEKTIFTTNTSTLLPSDMVKYTDRPEKFLALHFANGIWDYNIGEVMGHAGTHATIFEQVFQFANDIGMVPVRIEKEQGGYLLNSMITAWMFSSQNLVTNNVASPEDVDKTWMISTGMSKGPFGLMDMIGMETAYGVMHHWGEENNDEQLKANAAYIKEHFIDTNKLGQKTGEGYYKYPSPSYEKSDFLKA